MKKKIKLFSTIASLCLAVALMAFGVFAATQSTFSVSSKVSYKVSGEVHIQFNVSVAYTSKVTRAEGSSESKFTKESTSIKLTTPIVQVPGADAITESIDLGSYAFIPGATTQDYVEYTITVKNLGKYDVKVVVTNLLKSDSADSKNSVKITRSLEQITLTGETSETGTIASETGTIASETEAVFKVKFAMADPTTDYTETAFEPQFVVSSNQN